MDDAGLLFWLIVFGVAILQAVGQKKKKPGGPMGKPSAPPRPGQVTRGEQKTATASTRSSGGTVASPRAEGRGASSEGMIPADVWEEILGLARGTPPQPEPEPPVPPEAEPQVIPDRMPPPAVPEGAWDPEERQRPSTPKAKRPFVAVSAQMETEGPGDRNVRSELFGSGSSKELQKAIILQEVLGPPLSLREKASVLFRG